MFPVPSFLQDTFSTCLFLFLSPLSFFFFMFWKHHLILHEQCFERLDKFLAEQNGFYDDYGLEFVSPLANGLLHFDVIVRPFSSKRLSSTDGTTAADGSHVSETDALMQDSAPASTTSSPAAAAVV